MRDWGQENKLQGGPRLKDSDINKLNIFGSGGQGNICDHM